MKTRLSIATGLAVVTMLNATDLHGQSADTTRASDTTRRAVDTTRRAGDTIGVRVGSPPKNRDSAIPVVDGPIRLSADLSERTLTVVAGDNAIKTFTIAVGTSSKPTPKGSFRIRKIVWNPSWIPPDEPWAKGKTAKGPGEAGNPMKVAKIFFQEPDYYIHGTAAVNSLGTADSHGCLRMSPDEVAELAKFLMDHGGNVQEEGWFSRVVHLRWKTHTVILDRPISLTISE